MVARQGFCVEHGWAEISFAPQASVLCTRVGYHLSLYPMADDFLNQKQFGAYLLIVPHYLCALTEWTYTGFYFYTMMRFYFSTFLCSNF